MGNTWEVEVWRVSGMQSYAGYEQFWSGESAIKALWNFWRAKRQGYGCVTLHWR